MAQFEYSNETDGTAAIGICESLLLALIDLKVISEQVAYDVLADVVSTHTEAASISPSPEKHLAVVRAVNRLLVGKGQTKLGE